MKNAGNKFYDIDGNHEYLPVVEEVCCGMEKALKWKEKLEKHGYKVTITESKV